MRNSETIRDMIHIDKDDLNLFRNERRLVLLAILKSNYNLKLAYELNAPFNVSFEGYLSIIRRCNISVRKMKKEYPMIKLTKKLGKSKC